MKPILDRPLPTLPLGGERIEIIENEAALAALGPDWDALFAACDRPSPCANHAWVCAWWEAFGENPHGAGRDTRPVVVVVRDGTGALIGIAPFFEERPRSWTRVRRLRAMGFLGGEGTFDMTEEPSFLCLPGSEAWVLARVAEALRPGLEAGRWDAATFRVHADAHEEPLKAAFRRLRSCALLKADVRAGSDYAELPATWAEYRKAMTRSMRDNLPYYPRLLTRDGHDWHLRTLRDPRTMPEAAARLAALHRSRAGSERGLRHNDHIHGPAQGAFLACLLERLAARGEAFVTELVVAGRVVASQAFVESGDGLTVYYSGFDEAWYKYSPVFVIDAAVFREALERGVRRLDFLRNPAPWKARWLAAPGPAMHRALLVSTRPASLVRYGLHATQTAFNRNVADRLPVLTRRLADGVRDLQAKLRRETARLTTSALPLVNRLHPVAHWTLAHHRMLGAIPLHHLR